MDLAGKAAHSLARRSSRRQFFKFLGAGSLGASLFLTRTGVSLGSVSGCVGCGGGPCNPCVGIGPICDNLSPPYPCKTCQQGGGCPVGCSTSGEWFCCLTGTVCRQRCSECNCPTGCSNPSCHCFMRLGMPCTPRPHSSDTPCPCPPVEAPVFAAAHG
ncbi:MAG TPA: hypothetical protein VGQ68_06515 [Gaiellaceae bacterium]|jgi:hypothetical protein|nr:hypothetical protein [Gaiellaceae bacterium]